MRDTEIVEIKPNVTKVVYCDLNGQDLHQTSNCTRETLRMIHVIWMWH